MSDRLEILKTYKTYVGGAFPRSESDRTYRVNNKKGVHLANACRCTRKDVRNAMVAARAAFAGWSGRSAYNRGQVLYRIAEMLEGRKGQFFRELILTGSDEKKAAAEVDLAIDRLIYFAGWTDKISQVFGTVNPVASSHFNFSILEPSGVVGAIAPDELPLLSTISLLAPVIASGNTILLLASEKNPLPAVSFGEVLHASDVPGGVVNILTGYHEEMAPALTSHLDLNAVINTNGDSNFRKLIDENGSISIKRVKHLTDADWTDQDLLENPYLIIDFMETKTTWHPMGV